ncbi:hypothetical protein [Bordetella phage vB_BbrM_PHB04]|uniref:Uncharacterized protein n=1 Tax=Bordetella phage vB_BbrM_PHB04 TaxID=2029657 RepID=A0A291LAJ6_9CAUD|nr:hypothetical protein HOS14_gp010 [Bordetella phage vB_BbrM_PHB04]ATI15628.1 hypothetical protein [Bordetella phage vB_BbrM_PHB04]
MDRTPNANDFTIPVEGIGAFRFARRTMRDELRIAAEFSRLTEGVETPTTYLATVAGWIATLKVLTVEAPGGWIKNLDGKPTNNLDEIDPLDDETYATLLKVHAVLREKEGSFRRGKEQAGKE